MSVAKLFAEDASHFCVVHDSKTTPLSLNEDISNINQWTYQWKLFIYSNNCLPIFMKYFLPSKDHNIAQLTLNFNSSNWKFLLLVNEANWIVMLEMLKLFRYFEICQLLLDLWKKVFIAFMINLVSNFFIDCKNESIEHYLLSCHNYVTFCTTLKSI